MRSPFRYVLVTFVCACVAITVSAAQAHDRSRVIYASERPGTLAPPGLGELTFVYDFKGQPDGYLPSGGVISVNGALYGVTRYGGTIGSGTFFTITRAGEKIIHNFLGGDNDGAEPEGLPLNLGGTWYGTTANGGASFGNLYGIVYSMTPGGKLKILHDFEFSDGDSPAAGLTPLGGLLYGTAPGGGRFSSGVVFSISTTGTERTIYDFPGGAAGGGPMSSLLPLRGKLYGTTYGDGAYACINDNGCGVVYEISPGATNPERVLHAFLGSAGSILDGASPTQGLVELNGDLYGTAPDGGLSNCLYGCGVLYKVTLDGHYRVVHYFTGGADGGNPDSTLLNIGAASSTEPPAVAATSYATSVTVAERCSR